MLPFDVVNPDEISLAITADVTVKAAEGQLSEDYALSLSKDVIYISGTSGQKSVYVTLTNTGTKTDDKGEYPPNGIYHETLSFQSSYYEPLLLDAAMSIYAEEYITPTPAASRQKAQKEAVRTGDESRTVGMMVLLAVSAAAMLAVIRVKKPAG